MATDTGTDYRLQATVLHAKPALLDILGPEWVSVDVRDSMDESGYLTDKYCLVAKKKSGQVVIIGLDIPDVMTGSAQAQMSLIRHAVPKAGDGPRVMERPAALYVKC